MKKLFDEHLYRIVLQQLAQREFLDEDVSGFDLESFSKDKSLFVYQKEALENCFKVLLKYFGTYKGDKESFYHKCYKKYPHENLDNTNPSELLKSHFPLTAKRIEFYHFINRMGFWMTMGSGKSIVIIKLIELLDKAMNTGLIPKKNIYFFTANEGLLERFKQEIEEYNFQKDKKIEALSLKEYEDKKRNPSLLSLDNIQLFCYRADLMGEERKELWLDFNDYLDNGNNYVILDEAHKGDKQESKRQNIFSVLSKNGFLFNFSATFTDKSDIATTIYNLNQFEWVKKGYGKKLFLLDNNLKAFKDKSDLNEKEKQEATLKSLLLLALAKKYKLSKAYHDPMMVVFTNSVNTVEADAELFFKTLQQIVKDDVKELFMGAKKSLKDEFYKTKYLISDKEGEGIFEFSEEVEKIGFDELKELIFYAKNGNVEAIVNPKNKSEIAFKLDSSDKAFCLIKIGDISKWLKEKLKSVKVDESFKDESFFSSLDKSSINILIGSRAFYEGWDITRPNVMLFLNIGVNQDSKKLVTQSIGRGMRIESFENSRQRLEYIVHEQKSALTQNAKALETLFVVSTNKDAIDNILKWQEEQNKSLDYHEVSLEKSDIKDKLLFLPVYKSSKISADKIERIKAFKLSEKNKQDLRIYLNNLGAALFCLRHNVHSKKEYELFKKIVNDNEALFVDENIHYKSLNQLIEKLKSRLFVKKSDVKTFKALSDEIVHFRKISVRDDKKDGFFKALESSKKMQNLSDDEVYKKSKEEGIELLEAVKLYQAKELLFEDARFQKMLHHCYNPIISGENIQWLRNIISEKSEIVFLKELEKICKKIDQKYDWWMFSKINQYYDKDIFIPYVADGEEKAFYPDFIFWLQKGDHQSIVFVDPKGIEHTSYEHKVDGYEEIFLNKEFKKDKINIKVKLALINITQKSVSGKYKQYWYSKGDLERVF